MDELISRINSINICEKMDEVLIMTFPLILKLIIFVGDKTNMDTLITFISNNNLNITNIYTTGQINNEIIYQENKIKYLKENNRYYADRIEKVQMLKKLIIYYLIREIINIQLNKKYYLYKNNNEWNKINKQYIENTNIEKINHELNKKIKKLLKIEKRKPIVEGQLKWVYSQMMLDFANFTKLNKIKNCLLEMTNVENKLRADIAVFNAKIQKITLDIHKYKTTLYAAGIDHIANVNAKLAQIDVEFAKLLEDSYIYTNTEINCFKQIRELFLEKLRIYRYELECMLHPEINMYLQLRRVGFMHV